MSNIPREGIIVPLVTPFTKEEDVDYEGYKKNVETLVEKPVHGFIVLPTAGEAPSLTTGEKKRLIDIAFEVAAKKKPLIIGVGGLCIKETEELIKYAENCDADGLFVISPYFYKVTSPEYLSYYQRIARSTPLELLIYNSTYAAVPLTLSIIEELAIEPNIVAIKEGNQGQLGDVVRRSGEQLSVFTSRDLYIYETLALGGQGAIAFSANVFPELAVAIYKAASAGDFQKAREYQWILNPFVWALVQRSYPAPLKAAMTLSGLVGGHVRRPLSDLNADEVKSMEVALEETKERLAKID